MQTRIEADIRGWDAISEHRTGTDGDQQTAEWLADTISAAGAEPYLDTFPFTRRVLHECAVNVGNQRAEGIPLFDGGYTSEHGITAMLAPLIEGSTGNAAQIGVTPFSPIDGHSPMHYLRGARSNSYGAIVAHAAAEDGIVPGLALLNAPFYHEPYGPPVLQVATEHRDWLNAAATDGAEAKLVAHVTIEQTSACNVQTIITGHNPTLDPLVIMTPRSAWWTCTAERAGGIALWLECIRHFAAAPANRTVIFTANTGHELGHVGLKHYLAREADLVSGAHAWIHLGANFATVDSNVRYQASPKFHQIGLDALAAADTTPEVVIPVGARPLGEAYNIHDGGGHYLSLLGSNRWFHHPDDRWPSTIDLARTVKLNQAIIDIARSLASIE